MDNKFEGSINIATGVQTSISHLAETIAELTDFKGQLNYDTNQPAGQKEGNLILIK